MLQVVFHHDVRCNNNTRMRIEDFFYKIPIVLLSNLFFVITSLLLLNLQLSVALIKACIQEPYKMNLLK